MTSIGQCDDQGTHTDMILTLLDRFYSNFNWSLISMQFLLQYLDYLSIQFTKSYIVAGLV